MIRCFCFVVNASRKQFFSSNLVKTTVTAKMVDQEYARARSNSLADRVHLWAAGMPTMPSGEIQVS